MGTPSQTLSKTEFHPQCVQNAPMAACAKTSLCGAQVTIFPLFLFLISSLNPSGNGGTSSPPATKPGRTTHRNGTPLRANPHAISSKTPPRSTQATLPRLT